MRSGWEHVQGEGQVECRSAPSGLCPRMPAVLEIGLFGGAQRAVRTNLTERWRQHEADGKRKREEKKRDRKREKKRERERMASSV